MADSAAIAAAGLSIQRLLTLGFQEREPISKKQTKVSLVRTEDLDDLHRNAALPPPHLSIFLYRVDFNKTMRACWSAVGSDDGRGHLALDLHYLLTAWAENAEYEHRIIGRALECIEATAVLAGPLLHPAAGWAPQESLQLLLEEISTEALMRIFDSLPTDYHLSVPYIARVVRIDTERSRLAAAVAEVRTDILMGGVP